MVVTEMGKNRAEIPELKQLTEFCD
jgi:hypothetical protein